MLEGVMLLWFTLTAAGVVFVAIDIRTTPESPVLKWGFILLCAYTGPIGVFLYVLGCREPLSGLHERYVAVRWRQVLGSTMHCVAGDGVGILAGAVVGAFLALPRSADVALEYALGFGFGWSIFQALFMRGMSGGSYRRALADTFIPELLSMNLLMAGMVPVMVAAMARIPQSHDPLSPEFWFVMSMALLAGFLTAYPINWWLVANHLKHGMMTVRRREKGVDGAATGRQRHETHTADAAREGHGQPAAKPSAATIRGVTALSFVALAAGLALAALLGGTH